MVSAIISQQSPKLSASGGIAPDCRFIRQSDGNNLKTGPK
jgi:hypothetical protein